MGSLYLEPSGLDPPRIGGSSFRVLDTIASSPQDVTATHSLVAAAATQSSHFISPPAAGQLLAGKSGNGLNSSAAGSEQYMRGYDAIDGQQQHQHQNTLLESYNHMLSYNHRQQYHQPPQHHQQLASGLVGLKQYNHNVVIEQQPAHARDDIQWDSGCSDSNDPPDLVSFGESETSCSYDDSSVLIDDDDEVVLPQFELEMGAELDLEQIEKD